MGFGSMGYQIINQHTDVCLRSRQDEGLFLPKFECCIYTSNESLTGRFLISTGSVDLAREVESLQFTGFQGVSELDGIDKVVFNRVPGSRDFCVFQAWNRTNKLQLCVVWEACAQSVGIIFSCGKTLWLQENLVSVLVSKTVNLVLNRGQ